MKRRQLSMPDYKFTVVVEQDKEAIEYAGL
jgi:hypothetical protein